MLVLIILLLLFFSWLSASEVWETKFAGRDLELLNYGLVLRTTEGLIYSISVTDASIVCGSESLLLMLILTDDLCLNPFGLPLLTGDGDFSVRPKTNKQTLNKLFTPQKHVDPFGPPPHRPQAPSVSKPPDLPSPSRPLLTLLNELNGLQKLAGVVRGLLLFLRVRLAATRLLL